MIRRKKEEKKERETKVYVIYGQEFTEILVHTQEEAEFFTLPRQGETSDITKWGPQFTFTVSKNTYSHTAN